MTDLDLLREMLRSAKDTALFTGGPKSLGRVSALTRAIAVLEACEHLDQVATHGPSGVVRVVSGHADGWSAIEPAMGPADYRKSKKLDELIVAMAGEYA